tara:strand:+ start:18 stop:473 length:456 start_codon:yes stop_codon:yes gene_type:complete
MTITKSKLSDATIEVTINSNLSSTWILTEKEDNSKKWFVDLMEHNPCTLKPWEDEAEVRSMEAHLKGNPNFWEPVITEAERKTYRTPYKAEDVRVKRDALLNKYEWTVTSPDLDDSKKAEWKTYRQALRDLPAQSGFPWEDDGMTWPTKPA